MKKVLKKIFLTIVFLIIVVVLFWASKYVDRVRYIEYIFDINTGDMIENSEGVIKPGTPVHWVETMQLKFRVKTEDKVQFLRLLEDNFELEPDSEYDRIMKLLELDETCAKYADEIKTAGIEKYFTTCRSKDFCMRYRYIFVTEQEGEMIVYFMDID